MNQKNKGCIFVLGPSGSGKTTFCKYFSQFYDQINREYILINLDPGNENDEIEFSIDIRELITTDDVMQEFELGPNGSLFYCTKFLYENKQWLFDQLENKQEIFIFDLPGQIELYMDQNELPKLILDIDQKFGQSICLQLFDSFMSFLKSL